ncbi:MAG TPA: hypothetical protein DCP90_00625 [Clostridiales bacterium]|nr:MAG: hypothetical protein A2Y22_00525 [Clostridiales bacterium GWD2_32_59]HAN09101.1 hypothetical protein [Clostridiales bacterium]
MFKKLTAAINGIFFLAGTTALAAQESVIVTTNGTPDTLEEFFGVIIEKIMPIAYQIGGFLIVLAVVMIGFDLIKHRKDNDKRKEALHSILWLAVGAFIIGSAVVIAGIIWNQAT